MSVKEKRQQMVNFLNERGMNVTLKMSTVRLQKKYNDEMKRFRKEFDKSPNPFAQTKTERNRNKRNRRKQRNK
jgi:hypothetical protein